MEAFIAYLPLIAVLILSIVLHETAHGYAADRLGDPTARLQGRLSLNPLVHIDPLGSVIIPALLILSGSPFLFGWAKPVPYNPYNLHRAPRWGEAIVAAAGPAVNLLLALIFAALIRAADLFSLSASFLELAISIVFINVLLALFNLLPFPPLDGSKILMTGLPFQAAQSYRRFVYFFERFSFLALFAFILVFVFILADPFFRLVSAFVRLLTGLG